MKKYLALVLAVLMVLAFCACGDKAETTETATEPTAAAEAPAAEAEAPAAEAPAVEAATTEGGASGEPSGEPMGNQNTDFEVTVDGKTGTAHYEDTDAGDETSKAFVITWDGKDIEGSINKGVWTAKSGDAGDQAVVDAVKAAFETNNGIGGASGEPSAEPAA